MRVYDNNQYEVVKIKYWGKIWYGVKKMGVPECVELVVNYDDAVKLADHYSELDW